MSTYNTASPAYSDTNFINCGIDLGLDSLQSINSSLFPSRDTSKSERRVNVEGRVAGGAVNFAKSHNNKKRKFDEVKTDSSESQSLEKRIRNEILSKQGATNLPEKELKKLIRKEKNKQSAARSRQRQGNYKIVVV